MSLGITKNDDESWRECAARYGRKYGLESEVLDVFDEARAAGESEADAAFIAVTEWDCADLVDD